jgi:hypothetical protein
MHLSRNRRVDSSFVGNLSYPWLFRNECKMLSQRFSLRAVDRNSTFKVEEHVLHQHRCNCPIAFSVLGNPQHKIFFTVVSATSAPPFQSLHHQRSIYRQGVFFLVDQTDGSHEGPSSGCKLDIQVLIIVLEFSAELLGLCVVSYFHDEAVSILPFGLTFSINYIPKFRQKFTYDTEFTLSLHLSKWSNSTPRESKNVVSITFPADGVTSNF